MLLETTKEIRIILENDKKEIKKLQKKLIEKVTKEEIIDEIIGDLFLTKQILEEKDRKLKALIEQEQIKETLKEE